MRPWLEPPCRRGRQQSGVRQDEHGRRRAALVLDGATARSGDPRAIALLEEATTALARSLLGLVALIDPGLIVIGGGLSRAEDLVVVPTVAKTRAMATFHQIPPIVPAALGVWGAAWGAALQARAAV